ncbi:hypothetical protein NL676_031160 [Syzygium grande]|nr:hypothetical protein NL676_031160 [Syzygium grande]
MAALPKSSDEALSVHFDLYCRRNSTMTRRMPNLPRKKRLRLEGVVIGRDDQTGEPEVPEASSPVIGTVEGGSSERQSTSGDGLGFWAATETN